jgi:hypothetical protein
MDLIHVGSHVVRFISAEPLREMVTLPEEFLMPSFASDDDRYRDRLVIAGDESGATRRPGNLAAHLHLVEQCRDTGACFFEKQLNIEGTITSDMTEFPAELRIRQFPSMQHAEAVR